MAITVNDFEPSVSILDTDKISQTDDKIRTIISEAGAYLETESKSAFTQLESDVNTKLSEVTNNPDFTYTADAIDTMIENAGKYPIAKSSLLKGTFSLSNTVIEAGFGTKLYTGNGSTQSINAGIDLATQWGDSANETYGGLVIPKGRNVAESWDWIDTIRGGDKTIHSNTTDAEETVSIISQFTSTGFDLTSSPYANNSGTTYASWIFQTTHRISGTTNHGKAYTCHYNPITGFTMVKYEGSGIAGHEIPHHLGRELGIFHIKNLSITSNWWSDISGVTGTDGDAVYLNLTNAKGNDYTTTNGNTVTNVVVGTSGMTNTSGSTYILYGWANSYYDANVLNGSYEVGIYNGTGTSGNKITTRGKPAWLMVKVLSTTGNCVIVDNQRADGYLYPNLSYQENYYGALDLFDFYEDGFSPKYNTGNDINLAGGQYLYMVAYGDTDGLSRYSKSSETSNIQATDAVISYSNGVGSNGAVSSIENISSGTTVTLNNITWDI